MAVAIGAGWALFLGFPVYVVLVLQQGGGLVGPWALGAAVVSIGLFVWLVVRYRPHILSFMVTHPWWYSVSCGIGFAVAAAVIALASWLTDGHRHGARNRTHCRRSLRSARRG